jgi:hypothetical protein
MNLGHKKQTTRKLLGVKDIVGSSLGQKVVSSVIPHVVTAIAGHNQHGINNYSNSADQMKEPMKGNQYKQTTSRPPQIEKRRKERSNSDSNKYA